MAIDMILRGGRVLDPQSGRDEIADLYVSKGRITSQDRNRQRFEKENSPIVIDVRGKLVLPGLIDFHAHVADTVIPLAVDPDFAGLQTGVTSVCDAGSCGWLNFSAFRRFIIPQAKTRIFALLHMSPFGEAVLPEIGYELFNEKSIRTVIDENRDIIRGIKLRFIGETIRRNEIDVLGASADIACKEGLPLIVHTGFSNTMGITKHELNQAQLRLLSLLKKGDVITHCFTAKDGGLLIDPSIRSALLEALGRGVLLDTAPGRGHMSFSVAREALKAGIEPALLGTDVVKVADPEPHFYNLTMVMSKMLALGIPLHKVVAMGTCNPADVLRASAEVGSLKTGMPADITILEIRKGDFLLADGAAGNIIPAQEILLPVGVVKAGVHSKVSTLYQNYIPERELIEKEFRKRKKGAVGNG